MSAFHSAQPRPRDQVPGSTPSAARKASRLGPDSRVQAMTTSQAGSPTPERAEVDHRRQPAVRAAAGCPPATSPWNQTGSLSQVAATRVVPDPSRRVAGDLVAECLDRVDGLVRVGRERAAAEEVVAAGLAGRPRPRRPAARRGSRPAWSRTRSGRRCATRSRSRRRASGRPTTRTDSPRRARPWPRAWGSAAAAAARGRAASAAPSRPAARTSPRSAAAPSSARRGGRSGCRPRRARPG